jgi:hypothetical protein
MRSLRILGVCTVLAMGARPATGQQAAITASVRVQPRTSLTTSTQILTFHVVAADEDAFAELDFEAAARAGADRTVLLTIDPPEASDDGQGPGAFDGTLRFHRDGGGTSEGIVDPIGPTTLARWTGGGVRSGRIEFRLRASSPGVYGFPVRVSLTVR